MTESLDLDAIEARARGSIIRAVGQWPPMGATPEETLALVARVRELEGGKMSRCDCYQPLVDRERTEGCDSGDLPQKGRLHLHRCVAAMRRRYERRCEALREALARAVLELGRERERAEKIKADVRSEERIPQATDDAARVDGGASAVTCMRCEWAQRNLQDVEGDSDAYHTALRTLPGGPELADAILAKSRKTGGSGNYSLDPIEVQRARDDVSYAEYLVREHGKMREEVLTACRHILSVDRKLRLAAQDALEYRRKYTELLRSKS